MSNNHSLHNVNEYTEAELYSILDLVNPTDRELEAKILMQIHKYENIGTKAAQRLAKFFNDIYNYFFETEDEIEGFTEQNETDDVVTEDVNTSMDISGNRQRTDGSNALTPGSASKSEVKSADKQEDPKKQTVGYTQNLLYSKGKLNPILQQTVKRVISVDSQYRNDKRTMSTEFTFNLSEPLKDVISLKLYSVQIPYTWYTIGKTYGNNFFMFKGRTPGIDTEYHYLKIEIEPGNYSPKDLIDTVNASITALKNTAIDTSMGVTQFSYNSYTSLCTLFANFNKSYNESSYYIRFPYWTSPYLTDNIETIPGFLGLQTDVYYSNKLKSVSYYNMITDTYDDIDGTDSTVSFIVNSNNNYFTIELYKGDYLSIMDNSFNIILTNGTYTRKELIAHVNTVLANESRLVNSSLLWKNIDSKNDYANNRSSNKSYMELTIKLTRTVKENIVNDNPKIKVVFPNVSQITNPTGNHHIWVNTDGDNACFGFYKYNNNIDDIIGEESPVYQSYNYPIASKPYILLKTNVENFANGLNDISFNVANSININGYTLEEYMAEINSAIRKYDALHNNICNSPPSDYVFTSTPENPYPTGTYAYMQDDIFNLQLDITNIYDERYYEIDLSGGIFYGANSPFNFLDEYNMPYASLTDLTRTYETSLDAAGIEIKTNQLIFTIRPKTSGPIVAGNKDDVSYEIRFPNTYPLLFAGYIQFRDAFHDVLTNYKDPLTDIAIFKDIRFTEQIFENLYLITLNIKINKRLIAKNYGIQFVDPIVETGGTNGWEDNLRVSNLMASSYGNATNIYDMSFNYPAVGEYVVHTDSNNNVIFSMDYVGKVQITGFEKLLPAKTITIVPGLNDGIEIIAEEEGVYTPTENNNLSFSIDPGIYSRDSLINAINRSIQSNTSTLTIATKTFFSMIPVDGRNYLKMNANITRNYYTKDYNVVFFDKESFATCVSGATSVQTATWDTTIGWIMGFREYTEYDISAPAVILNDIDNVISIRGDTGLSTNLYNYFLLCLDDFNQNRLNDGLVTITNTDTSIPLPSYASRADFVCDPVTGKKTYNTTTGLTEKQIYAAQAIANSNSSTESIGSSVSTKSYGTGPFVTDVFGLIPMKVSGLANGSSYVEFGGTMQNQERHYFGPVNIQRMAVKLVTDRGNLVDLNKANWSFSLICEQLKKLDPT